MYVFMHTCIHVYVVYTCVHMYVSMYIYICVCTYIHLGRYQSTLIMYNPTCFVMFDHLFSKTLPEESIECDGLSTASLGSSSTLHWIPSGNLT